MMTTIMTNDQKSKARKQFYLSQQIISSYGPYLKTNHFFHFLFKEIQQKPALTVKGNENGGLLNTVVDKCSSHKNLTLSHNYVILNLLCAEHVKQ